MRVKKFTKKDRYGNMMSFEFDVDSELNVQQVPPMGMGIPQYKAVGGMESNHPGDPKGSDTVPAWLTPGEFVVNKEATDMYGPIIKQMNDHGRAIQNGQKPPAQYADKGMEVIPGILPTPKPDVYNLFMKEKKMPSKFDIDRVDFTKINKYDDLIYKAAEKYGLDPEFLKAVLYTESAGKADAVGDKNMGKGNEAFGLGQISKRAFNDLVKDFPDYQFSFNSVQTHPVANIDAAAKYLSMQKNKYIPKANRGEKGWKENFIKSPEHEMHMMYQFYNAGPYEKSINAVQNANKVMAIKNKLEGAQVIPGLPKDGDAGNLYEAGATTSFPGEEKYENVVPMEKPVPTWIDRAGQIKDKFMDNFRWNEGGAIPPAYLEHGGWHWGSPSTWSWDHWNYDPAKDPNSNLYDSIPNEPVNNNPLPEKWFNQNNNTIPKFEHLPQENKQVLQQIYEEDDPRIHANEFASAVPKVKSPPINNVGDSSTWNIEDPHFETSDDEVRSTDPEYVMVNDQPIIKNDDGTYTHNTIKYIPDGFGGLKYEHTGHPAPVNITNQFLKEYPHADSESQNKSIKKDLDKYNKSIKKKQDNLNDVLNSDWNQTVGQNYNQDKINKQTQSKINNNTNKLEESKNNLEHKETQNNKEAAIAKSKEVKANKLISDTDKITKKKVDTKQHSESTITQTGEEGTDDNQKKTAMGMIQSFLGPLFDTQELKRMAVIYLGSRLLGYDHGGSLQYAAKSYLGRVDKKDAAIQKWVLENYGKVTPKSLQKFLVTRNPGDLIPIGTRAVDTGETAIHYGPNGSEVRARKFTQKGSDGQTKTMWYLMDGKTPLPANFVKAGSAGLDRTKSSPAWDKEVARKSENVLKVLKDVNTRFNLKKKGKEGEKNEYHFQEYLPSGDVHNIAEWAHKEKLDMVALKSRVGPAFKKMIQDKKAGNAIAGNSILPYLKEELIKFDLGKTKSGQHFYKQGKYETDQANMIKLDELIKNRFTDPNKAYQDLWNKYKTGKNTTAGSQWNGRTYEYIFNHKENTSKYTGLTPFAAFVQTILKG